MDCNETRRLLDANLDGELDLVRHLEIEEHLRSCPDCARLHENARLRRAAIQEKMPRFTAPAGLAEKIRAAIPVPMDLSAPASARVPSRKRPFSLWQFSGLAAGFACVLIAGFAWGGARARSNLLFGEAIAGHVRSLQAGHLTDVASTDQHTVKPWFAGKLDISPPVVDLASAGFPLTGGRLDYLNGRPAAALVFHRRQHAINLFIWPSSDATLSSRGVQRDGFSAEAWSQGGLNFLAVSDVPRDELAHFADAFRTASK